MGHGFINKGINTTFASKRRVAWHGLGKTVDAMTSKEAIVLGGLDYEVGLAPVYASLNSIPFPSRENAIIANFKDESWFYNISKNIPTNFATYRKDNNKIFGVVGSRYETIQNIEAFEFFDSIIGEGHAEYETVGALGNGERVFITAKIPGKLLIGKENIDKYLLLTMAHDGSGAIEVMFTPIRVVCNNTLTAALRTKSKISIRHTKNARNKLEVARRTLGLIDKQTREMEELFNIYLNKRVNDDYAKAIFKKSFGITENKDDMSTRAKNTLYEIEKAYHSGIGQEGIVGTAWGVYNGVTTYLQNTRKFKNNEKLFKDTFLGKDELIKNKAVKALNELVL